MDIEKIEDTKIYSVIYSTESPNINHILIYKSIHLTSPDSIYLLQEQKPSVQDLRDIFYSGSI